jgi:hypothetical protein
VSSGEGLDTRPPRRSQGCGQGASDWREWSWGIGHAEGENLAGVAMAIFKGGSRAVVGPDAVGWDAHAAMLPPDVSSDGTGGERHNSGADLTPAQRSPRAGEAAGGPARVQQCQL